MSCDLSATSDGVPLQSCVGPCYKDSPVTHRSIVSTEHRNTTSTDSEWRLYKPPMIYITFFEVILEWQTIKL